MTLPMRFLLLVVVVATAAAAMMIPRSDERFAVMRDNRRQAEIVAELEPRLIREGDKPNLLAMLGQVHADLGHAPRAIELLERYIALRPNDAEAYGELAKLYGQVGDSTRQIGALERSIALTPKLPRVVELAALYRSAGTLAKERDLLQKFEPELTVQNGLLLRLAQIYANDGETGRSINLLRCPDVTHYLRPAARNDEERLLLASLLAETGSTAEAARLGAVWITQWHEPWLANRLLVAVATHTTAPAKAFPLADAVAGLHPAIRLFLVKQLAEQGAPAVARHLLATWPLANPRPSMDELAAFLSACREWAEPAIVWDAFSSRLKDPVAPEITARYAEAIAAEFGIGALAPFWPSMQAAVLEKTPLLAARLAFAEGDVTRTSWLLGSVNVMSLSASDQKAWADLLTASTSPEAAFATLRALRQSGGLPPTLLVQYARLAGSLGQEGEYQTALAGLRGSK